MPNKKREHPAEKTSLHPRNKHRERYNFRQLVDSCSELGQFVKLNDYNDQSIDFFNPLAVKTLNKALLKYFYGIDYWDIPANYLCPPIPGRADYIHYMADLLGSVNSKHLGEIPTGSKIKCLDIGVGANCVYPIIGSVEYGWSFVGSEIDSVAIENANQIVDKNSILKGKIELRMQKNSTYIFNGIIGKNEQFDLTICNPPFHASLADAQGVAVRKLQNLKGDKIENTVLNFGGQSNELWCEGGEEKFVKQMILESKQFAASCLWFSTLISKQSSLKNSYKTLETVGAYEVKTISMSQGNKISRIVAWTFLTGEQQQKWTNSRWGREVETSF
jgi:23S rRNA (adenine1618-N6)-methyltransferase